MKRREGFISNSSSSSFLVAFDKIPTSVEELQKMLFGDYERYGYYEKSYSTKEISEIVFKDMKKEVPGYDPFNGPSEFPQPLETDAVIDLFQNLIDRY